MADRNRSQQHVLPRVQGAAQVANKRPLWRNRLQGRGRAAELCFGDKTAKIAKYTDTSIEGCTMSPPLYDVILTNQIAPGYDRQTVVAALARLLGRDEQQITDLMQTGNHAIKSNVDARTGQQYIQSLASTGAVVRLEPGRSPEVPVAADGDTETVGDATDLNIRVISPRPRPADVAFAPIQANRITPAPGGASMSTASIPRRSPTMKLRCSPPTKTTRPRKYMS